ncbi:MAG: S8 family serine peptidase [Bacteroidota bacterium]
MMIKQLSLFTFLLSMGLGLFAQDKQVITRADQLPRRTIELPTSNVMELIGDKEALDKVEAEVKANVLKDLETYDIQDKSTLKGYYSTLQLFAMYEKDYETAMSYSKKQKELAEKEAERLTTGLGLQARIKAMKDAGADEGAAFEKAYEKYLYELYAEIPFEKIRESVEARKGSMSMMSENVLKGSIQGQIQPILDQMGTTVPENIGATMVGLRVTMDALNVKEEALAVYTRLLDENPSEEVVKVDIWSKRNVNFPTDDGLEPVVIGVWDTGVDMEVLKAENRYTNTQEKKDGKDNDGNGFVDDIHGVAFDQDYSKHPEVLQPATDITYDLGELEAYIKGSLDLQSNIDSDEANKLKTYITTLEPSKMQTFMEDLTWYSTYSHGTHVAGIAQEGNPAAKILAARLEYSTKTVPPPPTIERAKRNAQSYTDVVKYFQQAGVRVVNMSWRYSASAYEQLLAVNGIGETAEERQELAKKIFQIERDALYKAIAGAKDILFICGSGNENNSADFQEYIPAGFNLDNIITIGAVDSEGKKTSFTTEGKSVDFYANGYEVESFVPGGNRLKFSGTSMASPNVANLAGKLFAVNPNLSVSEAISYIEQGVDVSDEGIKLINPKKSLTALAMSMQDD